jgi:hypothetical protein
MQKNQIEFILDGFDFERVATAMKSLDWKYNQSAECPTVIELRKIARKCLTEASNSRQSYEMGGFEAETINGLLELRFIIEKHNSLKHILG